MTFNYKVAQRASVAARRAYPVRQPCEVCGSKKTERHHDDYSEPLKIRWFCRKHHRAFHATQRGALRSFKITRNMDAQDVVIGKLLLNRGRISEISRRSKISYRYILAVIRGDIKEPSFRRLVRLAGFLGIRVTYESCEHFTREGK